MVGDMKDSSLMIKGMASAYSNGSTVEFTTDLGRMDHNMGMANTFQK